MLRAVPLLLLIAAAVSSPQTVDLAGTRRIQSGDDLAWARPDFDDSSWQTTTLPRHTALRVGRAWYRRTLTAHPPTGTLAIGPDGMLYITVGSTCNECTETSPESATILRAKPDGTARTIYASGLRNTIGFDWHPVTKQLWGFDHGIDWLGDNEQGEELNLLTPGAKYGWPYVYADSKFNLQDEPPNKQTWEQWARASKIPARLYTAHSAPMQLVFYTGNDFPPEYRNDAFVTMRGSWNRKPPSGYEVVRVHFENGKPVSIEPFLTGILKQEGDKWTLSGRPVGLAQLPDGSLLVGDDTNGTIYRITYADRRSRSRP